MIPKPIVTYLSRNGIELVPRASDRMDIAGSTLHLCSANSQVGRERFEPDSMQVRTARHETLVSVYSPKALLWSIRRLLNPTNGLILKGRFVQENLSGRVMLYRLGRNCRVIATIELP